MKKHNDIAKTGVPYEIISIPFELDLLEAITSGNVKTFHLDIAPFVRRYREQYKAQASNKKQCMGTKSGPTRKRIRRKN